MEFENGRKCCLEPGFLVAGLLSLGCLLSAPTVGHSPNLNRSSQWQWFSISKGEELDHPNPQDDEIYSPAPDQTHTQDISTQTFVWESRLEAVGPQDRFFFKAVTLVAVCRSCLFSCLYSGRWRKDRCLWLFGNHSLTTSVAGGELVERAEQDECLFLSVTFFFKLIV